MVNYQGQYEIFKPKGFNGIIHSDIDISGIGEYKWSKNTFVFTRFRQDKDNPNFLKIALDVWNDIQNPITEQQLLQFLNTKN